MRFLLSFLLLCTLIPLRAQEEEELDSAALMNAFMEMFNSESVEVKPEYVFEHNVHYRTEKIDLMDGEEKEEFDLYFSSGSKAVGMAQVIEKEGKTGNLFAAFDMSTNSMATFIAVDTMKMCMRMKLPDTGDPDEVHFTKTGKKKRIAGMEAAEWSATDNDEEVRLWIAESTVGDLSPVFSAFGDLHGQGGIHHGDYGNGLVLAGSSKKRDGKKPHFTFEATKVALNTPFTFKSEGYRIGM